MILRMPDYYKNFKCTAEQCSDNCCIGWEIDIDRDKMDFYRTVNGKFGKKLKENISEISVPHFILNQNKRCPFLSKNNLCEIFINLGENNLCSICSEHPRFYEWYNNIKEGGIGLCCEAAAKIILSSKSFGYYDTLIPYENCEEYDENFYDYLFTIRKNIIEHLSNKNIPLKNRLNNILQYTYKLQNNYDNFNFEIPNIKIYDMTQETADLTDIFLYLKNLESMNDHRIFEKAISNYKNIAERSNNFFKCHTETYDYLENTAIYFVWRHFIKSVFEEEFYSKIAFAVLSTIIIGILYVCEYNRDNDITLKKCIKISVSYSKEIEYSDQNLNCIFDFFYDNIAFSIENLEKMLNIF